MTRLLSAAIAGLAILTAPAQAQTNPPPAAEQPWRYQTKRLNVAEVDALLAQPTRLLVLDVRRPDELIRYGSFPVFLNVQYRELESQIAWLPTDRAILTVSNHAQRAGAAGDLLRAKGFEVAGATGSEDYEQAGGKAVAHIQPPKR
ncbi:rhodanese-like domain-containing protein [Aquincola sp. S2]|uniref:Rhodanese-like domain-containing protein n=1 Tax=Pseudaquabacterium terrae TaxID=2732868 RepID=A0ABX2EPL5_9BURK|nr:rhodanese-like domain-containing protein [Aquabacterium terrae]NRF70587.1 rhodanese-like domain-containing protein [Aquabacterium terrae]